MGTGEKQQNKRKTRHSGKNKSKPIPPRFEKKTKKKQQQQQQQHFRPFGCILIFDRSMLSPVTCSYCYLTLHALGSRGIFRPIIYHALWFESWIVFPCLAPPLHHNAKKNASSCRCFRRTRAVTAAADAATTAATVASSA